MSSITKNKELSSTNPFAMKGNPSVRSFMQIKNNKRPSMKPWSTPALTFFHVDYYSLRLLVIIFHLRSNAKPLVNFSICHFELL